jgi:hypothetical protein
MPLRDHFREPVIKRASWETFHGMWPAMIVSQLRKTLPAGYTAGPTVHLGAYHEIDIATYESDNADPTAPWRTNGGGVAVTTWQLAERSVALELEPEAEYEYSVQIYDSARDRTLVAVIELVSPGNKDRPETRNNFVAKCAGLLRAGVSVCIVDLVTEMHFNLYTQLLEFIGQPRADRMSKNPPATYSAACRWGKRGEKNFLEAWANPLEVGQPLPLLPLWLAEDIVIPLDLEKSYEAACHDLWIS